MRASHLTMYGLWCEPIAFNNTIQCVPTAWNTHTHAQSYRRDMMKKTLENGSYILDLRNRIYREANLKMGLITVQEYSGFFDNALV